MKYFPTNGSAEREDGQICVFLNSRDPNIPPVPIELQNFISGEDWERRLIAINQLARRYSRLTLERVWVFVGFLLSMLAPVLVFKLLEQAKGLNGPNNLSREEILSNLDQIRLITLGVSIGIFLIIWAPLILWKSIGRYRMRALVREWAQNDILAIRKGVFVPMWSVSLPSSYSASTIVRVTIPTRMNPSSFHPDAYLPPYIAPPQYNAGYTQMGYTDPRSGQFMDVKV